MNVFQSFSFYRESQVLPYDLCFCTFFFYIVSHALFRMASRFLSYCYLYKKGLFYFVLSYIILCFGIALSNRCKLPIIPTDLFPRDLSEIIKKPYSVVKITFDVTCLVVTACLTYFALGKILGLGVGTVVAAFTMGKGVSIAGNLIDKKMTFVSVLQPRQLKKQRAEA